MASGDAQDAGDLEDSVANAGTQSSETALETTLITVTTGLESSYYVEISGDGLKEGMRVVIPSDATEDAKEQSDTTDSTTLPFGNTNNDMQGGRDNKNFGGGNPSGGNNGGAPGGAAPN
jgi:hypothetical protein